MLTHAEMGQLSAVAGLLWPQQVKTRSQVTKSGTNQRSTTTVAEAGQFVGLTECDLIFVSAQSPRSVQTSYSGRRAMEFPPDERRPDSDWKPKKLPSKLRIAFIHPDLGIGMLILLNLLPQSDVDSRR